MKLQSKVVLENLDIVAATGGKNTAFIKEFEGIMADRTIKRELIPKAKEITDLTVPIISGIEIQQGK